MRRRRTGLPIVQKPVVREVVRFRIPPATVLAEAIPPTLTVIEWDTFDRDFAELLALAIV